MQNRSHCKRLASKAAALARQRRSAIGRRPLLVPSRVGERWSMDFVADQLSNGRRFRLFNVIDDYSRECHVSLADFSIGGRRVAHILDQLVDHYGKPRAIVCDNGTEFTSIAMFDWARRSGVDLQFIQPGKPSQNGFCVCEADELVEAKL